MGRSLYISVRPSLAADRISLFAWLNKRFAVNRRWKSLSIIDITIDLFAPKDWYFLWIPTAPPCGSNPDLICNHACAFRCYTREAPVIPSGTWVRLLLLDVTMILLFRQPIMSPIIVFISGPAWLLVQTLLQSVQWPWKGGFFPAWANSNLIMMAGLWGVIQVRNTPLCMF